MKRRSMKSNRKVLKFKRRHIILILVLLLSGMLYQVRYLYRLQIEGTRYARESDVASVTDWEPFNNTNPHKNTWCPKAFCQNSPLCTPCQRRHLLIISTARSGSTTLLRMFNALPNVRLSGENHNQIKFVAKLTSNLLENRPRLLKHPMDKPTGPFMHNTIPQGSFGCIAQDIFHMMNPPPLAVQQNKAIQMAEYDKDLILGFKTIRMHVGDWTAQQASEYLKSHFPCSRMIINYKTNITHQYVSFRQTFGNSSETYSGPSMNALKKANQFQFDLYQNLGDDYSKLIDMDEWSKDVHVLNDILTWLGFDQCHFEAMVHENLNGYTRDTSTELQVGKHCMPPS